MIALLAGLMFAAVASYAQHGTLKGTIYYADSRITIPGVNVYVMLGGSITGTTTDINGEFTLKPLNPGVYNLNISYTGMDSIIISGVQVLPDKIEFLGDIYMKEKSESIGGIDVIAHKQKLINPEDPGKMSLLPAQLERTPGKRDMTNLITLVSPEIKVDTETNQIIVRGSRPGTSVYYVDGIKVSSTESLLPNTGIGSVTVYTGGIPAKYGDMTGGAIIMESKSYFDLLSAWEASQIYQKEALEIKNSKIALDKEVPEN